MHSKTRRIYLNNISNQIHANQFVNYSTSTRKYFYCYGYELTSKYDIINYNDSNENIETYNNGIFELENINSTQICIHNNNVLNDIDNTFICIN